MTESAIYSEHVSRSIHWQGHEHLVNFSDTATAVVYLYTWTSPFAFILTKKNYKKNVKVHSNEKHVNSRTVTKVSVKSKRCVQIQRKSAFV